ncbi:MAG: TRAP transporter substrate-binding protein DctP [Dehalococcoidales bacterium]|nr:TRAP transporter substrate-binding protein DctP [Dehalococcoidales bacterium]
MKATGKTKLVRFLSVLTMMVLVISILAMSACSKSNTTSTANTATTAAAAAASTTASTGKVTTLRFATFDAATNLTSKAFQDWADQLEKQTNGQYKVEFSWGSSMGQMAEHYDLVASGVADIAYFLPKMSTGLFPLSDVAEMPWVLKDYETSVSSIWDLYKSGVLDSEYSDVHVLFMFNGSDTSFFSKKPIDSVDQFKGMKIGGSTEMMVKALEGVQVTIGVPNVYSSLDKGIIDCESLAFSMSSSLKLEEIVKYAKRPAFGNPICAIAMNSDVWDSIPADVQGLMTKLVEDVMKPDIIQGYKDAYKESSAAFLNAGGTISDWSDADLAEMAQRFESVWPQWIDPLDAKGLNATAVVDKLKEILESKGVVNPAVGYDG